MATLGIDPAINQAIGTFGAGLNNLPDQYAAGQKHLLAQQVAAFNQHDKDRNFEINKPLKEAQTRFHTAKARETEGNTLAAELFPELSRKLLRPVRGLNGEPDRIEFNDDPNVLADVMSNLTRRGLNAETTINAYRSGVAGQLAAASKPGTSMPSANGQIAASRIGKDFGATTSSVFSVEDRDAVASAKERAAKDRLTTAQEGAWKRAQLQSDTSKANAATSQAGQDARTAATLKNRQEIEALRASRVSSSGGRISAELVNLVEGKNPMGGTDGFANVDVDAMVPIVADEKAEAYSTRVQPIKRVYADEFYRVYRTTNPPDAAAARAAARAAAKAYVDRGDTAPATATPAPGTTAAAPAADTPAAAIVATSPSPPAAAPYAAHTFSDPAQNIANARLEQIAASLGVTRQELVDLAKEQGVSIEEYVKSVTTPASEPVAVEEPANLINPEIVQNSGYTNLDTLRTPDTKTDTGAGIIPAADRLVAATTPPNVLTGPGSNRVPVSPLDSMPQQAAATPAQAVVQSPVSLEVPPASPEEMLYQTEQAKLIPAEQAPAETPAAAVTAAPAAAKPSNAAKPAAKATQAPVNLMPEPGLTTNGVNYTPAPINLSQIQGSSPMSLTSLPPSLSSGIQPSLMDSVKSGLEMPSVVSPAQMVSFGGTSTGAGSAVPKTPYERQLYELTSMLDVIKRHPVKSEERDGFGEPTGKFTSAEDEFRIKQLEQRIQKLKNDPIARVSPSAALLNNEFTTVPGLIVSGVEDVKEQFRDFVVTANEVRYLLGSYVKLPGKFASTDYAYPDANGRFIDGMTVAAQFDKAHPKLVNLFIREGRLGMKPGDSLGAKLIALHDASNMEIMEFGNKQNIIDFKNQIK